MYASDLEEEFDALMLNDEQIADAIFGLAAIKPGCSGHVALILRSLGKGSIV
jgi:hypothetical protein